MSRIRRNEYVKDEWRELKSRIGKILEKTEKMKGKKGGKRWWHDEYKEGKEKVRRELKIWRKEGISKVRYREEKRRYRIL